MKNTEKPFPHLPVLKKALVLGLVVSLSSIPARSQQNKALADADRATTRISKHIYGHFAEHLGRCIYDGFYVGENHAKIPNTNGVRNDIIQALRDLHIPNLRWPGGCFADTYHWKEGIGPKSERKAIENLWWGNYREDNSFGTHEFLDMCELLGAEPYLAVNMNTGSVQEASEWVQYVNHANGASHLTDLRAKNGRATPWKVKYWGIGNESWDCGGGMTVEHYSNLYRQFATAMTSWSNSEQLFRIAVGPGSPDYDWTETLMQNMPARRFEGLSVHHYSVIDWGAMGPSTGFSEEQYFKTMQRAWFMEEFVSKNSAIMDKYDPTKRVALIVDEWGGWYNTDLEGKGALYQQNTMRDAMIAGLTLNIFNNHADRVRMANLAQTVNVLQAVILTKEEKLLLTPTYHVMEMYKVHQEALLVPIQLISKDFEWGGQRLQAVSASASLDSLGKMHVSLVNIDPKNSQSVEIDLKGFAAKQVKGRVLASANIQDHNTFESPNRVKPTPFSQASLSGSRLTVSMPAGSVVVLELTQ